MSSTSKDSFSHSTDSISTGISTSLGIPSADKVSFPSNPASNRPWAGSSFLSALGWNSGFEASFARLSAADLVPARVISSHGRLCRLAGGFDHLAEFDAVVSGSLEYRSLSPADLPVCGDWVAVRPSGSACGSGTASENCGQSLIRHILPRSTLFSRAKPGTRGEIQVVAANVDICFIVMSLNQNFNIRRLERYLALSRESGAAPAVVLTKADLCDPERWSCPEEAVEEVTVASLGAPVIVTSCVDGMGLHDLAARIPPGVTGVFLGSSGVGKSSLVNGLSDRTDRMVVEIRSDGRGRHTTTSRDLVLLPGGGLVMDTPGMRELGLWDAEEGLAETFGDLEDLATNCRFRDCGHTGEPGCALVDAAEAGKVGWDRLGSYLRMKAENAGVAAMIDERARAADAKKRWKKIHAQGMNNMKAKRSWLDQ